MEHDKDIKKWLNHDLTDQERNAFEQDPVNSDLHALDQVLKRIDVPSFDKSAVWNAIKKEQSQTVSKKSSSLKAFAYIGRIAAILIIAFGVYQVVSSKATTYTTTNGEQLAFVLPDNSKVELNATSTISYTEKNWEDNRTLDLDGEAYFKVEKGSKFSVYSDNGIVTVLGTQFNIKDRQDYFEVICFEGSVEVKHIKRSNILKAGDSFKIIDGKIIATEKESNLKPSWIDAESTFISEPFKYVLNEFERQHDVKINTKDVDLNQLFTGTFNNRSLDEALKAITLPMQLTYRLDEGNMVTLSPKK